MDYTSKKHTKQLEVPKWKCGHLFWSVCQMSTLVRQEMLLPATASAFSERNSLTRQVKHIRCGGIFSRMPPNLCTVLACQISCDALTGRLQDIYETAAFILTLVFVFTGVRRSSLLQQCLRHLCVCIRLLLLVPVTCFRVLHTS